MICLVKIISVCVFKKEKKDIVWKNEIKRNINFSYLEHKMLMVAILCS